METCKDVFEEVLGLLFMEKPEQPGSSTVCERRKEAYRNRFEQAYRLLVLTLTVEVMNRAEERFNAGS